MACALDFAVIAEGIETDEQALRMVELGDAAGDVPLRGQGYLFGRPADGEVRLGGFVEVPDVAAAR